MNKLHPALWLLALPLLAPSQILAQTMKPGLWEMTQRPQLEPAQQAKLDQARKAMEAMPAEKRQMMEQMMAQRGMKMDMAGGGVRLQVCVSPQQAERMEPPIHDKGRCQHQTERSGNKVHSRFSCSDPAAEGDGDFVFDSAEHYSSQMRISRAGKPPISVSGEGRWLGSDCSALPAAASAPKHQH